MKYLVLALLVVHGAIHAMGFVKAFDLAALSQLTLPVSRAMGVAWLAAGLLVVTSAVLVFAWPQRWAWAVTVPAVVLSQVVIVSAWTDAKFGTLPNVLLLVAAVASFAMDGPWSLRAAYERDASLAVAAPGELLTEASIARLPRPVQAYLRYTGSVGQRVPRTFTARMEGRIRSGPDAPWMELRAEQRNTLAPDSRLFYLRATMFGLPVVGYHRLVGGEASMRIRVLGLVPVVDQAGAAFYETELVTVLNDLCILAPAALVDPRIEWRELDAHTVEATFLGRRSVLHFDDDGKLVNFVSDDRPALVDGALVPMRWSTPFTSYRQFGPLRLPSGGEGRYASPSADYAYIEIAFTDVRWD